MACRVRDGCVLQDRDWRLADSKQHVSAVPSARPFRPASGNVAAALAGGGEARIMTILLPVYRPVLDFIIGDLNTGPIRYAG